MNEYRLNWLAIVLAAVVHFLLGAVWFTTFTNAWLAGIGKTKEQMLSEAAGSGPAIPYIVAFICNLIMAYVLALVILRWGKPSAGRGAIVGIMLWVGFVGTVFLAEYTFELRPRSLFAITAGYPLLGLVLMGIILGGWTKRAA